MEVTKTKLVIVENPYEDALGKKNIPSDVCTLAVLILRQRLWDSGTSMNLSVLGNTCGRKDLL